MLRVRNRKKESEENDLTSWLANNSFWLVFIKIKISGKKETILDCVWSSIDRLFDWEDFEDLKGQKNDKEIKLRKWKKVMNMVKPKPNPQQVLRDWQRKLRQECQNIERQTEGTSSLHLIIGSFLSFFFSFFFLKKKKSMFYIFLRWFLSLIENFWLTGFD